MTVRILIRLSRDRTRRSWCKWRLSVERQREWRKS